jgi:hypothetical protein
MMRVWGNTLMPMIMAGDDKQLQPVVLSKAVKRPDGTPVNRFAADGVVSPLLWMKIQGWPVFRLRIQWRMADGMFDLCHMLVYGDTELKYGPTCNIGLEDHAPGRELEDYLQRLYPKLKPPPNGQLYPAWIDCKGTFTVVHQATMSKSNRQQCEQALELLVGLIDDKHSNVSVNDLVIICPYKANADLVSRMLAKSKVSNPFSPQVVFRIDQLQYGSLKGMRAPATVDSYQGKESKIVCLIMGTTPPVGTGFTKDVHRLV